MVSHRFKGVTLSLVQGDITTQQVDVIVNAAHSGLSGGGGVDGAIHRAGGPEILAACRAIVAEQGECPPGRAVLTTAGALPARFVAHAVGPIWRGGGAGEFTLLERCYRTCLELAVAQGAASIAFPAISTGAYQFPMDRAAYVAWNAVVRFVTENPGTTLQEVRLVAWDDPAWEQLHQAFVHVTRTMLGSAG